MNTVIERRMREIVRQRFPHAPDAAITSEQIYEQLLQEGFPVQDNEMDEIFDDWMKGNLVRGTRPVNQAAHIKHGSIIITGISPLL